uniref:Uncharacterized protein n=1 Tax=Heterorhabditis bacteriophora TaxID=37862 RepID=A0A1I7W9B9_HETBA
MLYLNMDCWTWRRFGVATCILPNISKLLLCRKICLLRLKNTHSFCHF